MKVAFVHEYLNQFGGAERVLRLLCDIFPGAPVYTLIYDEKLTLGIFKDREVLTSFLQNLPFSRTRHEFYPLLMPLAIEQFDFSEYDLVISLSASFAKGIIVKPSTKHICYCLTPPRFLWDNSQRFLDEFGFPFFLKKLIPPFLTYLRVWDKQASLRPDKFWAISNFVRDRIKKYYRLEAEVVYPPVETSIWYGAPERDPYYLMVGRLVSYKKFDIAVETFNKLGLPLIIAGNGPQLKALKKISRPNVVFEETVSDEELASLYSRAAAVIFPQEEDFGIVPLEAMASGCPVIAYRAGGALETVIDGETGIFFDEQTPSALIAAVKKFENLSFKPEICRAQAQKFDVALFKDKIFKSL